MPCVSLQRKDLKFQEEPSDLETQLLELGFLCENPDDVGTISASFAYNAHGSMTSMPHLSAMDWDFAEKLCHVTRGTTEAYYSYDGSGVRTRKVVEKNGTVETRLYLGGFEIWRKTVNGTLETERETLHFMDDKRRVALVETLTVENGNNVANPAPVQRYQLDNHLGSASLELDGTASIISYEEYYPYGDTSYRAGRSASEVSQKRYRYTGKEKDEESSLYYCEQRYYAAHISRWVSTDPTWLEDGINLYAYVNGNPVSGVDPSGTQTVENDDCEQKLEGVSERIIPKYLYVNGVKASDVVQIDKEIIFPEEFAGNFYSPNVDIRTFGDVWKRLPDNEDGTKGDGGFTYNSPKYVMSDEEALSYISNEMVHNILPVMLGENLTISAKTGIKLFSKTLRQNHSLNMKVRENALSGFTGSRDDLIKIGINPNDGFKTFAELKKSIGPAGKGMEWHHIVEQSQIKATRSGFSPELIQNPANIIAVDKKVHALISSYYSSKQPFTNGLTVRNWLSGKSFKEQYDFGMKTLKQFGR